MSIFQFADGGESGGTRETTSGDKDLDIYFTL